MPVLRTLLTLAAAVVLVWAQGCDRTINMTDSGGEGQPLSCAECHDSSALITSKTTSWAASAHGMGESYVRGSSASCAGCHSGTAFAEQVVGMGLAPNELNEGDPEPTRQDCRACHMIHETYTMDDFALKTQAPVTMYAVSGVTYNGGMGNLCVNCHQPRRVIPEPEGGVISGISSHWGPHHGPQSAMLMGVAGGGIEGSAHGHYGGVANTCVDCHMGEGREHLFEPSVDNCTGCHPDLTSFDYKQVQTNTEALITQLGDLLVAANLIDENTPDGHPIVSEAPEDQAIALWNWIYVAHEDKSLGVHNPPYAQALLEEGLRRMGATP